MRISFHEFDHHHHGIDGVLSAGLAGAGFGLPTHSMSAYREAGDGHGGFWRGRKAGEPRVDDRRSASGNGTESQDHPTTPPHDDRN